MNCEPKHMAEHRCGSICSNGSATFNNGVEQFDYFPRRYRSSIPPMPFRQNVLSKHSARFGRVTRSLPVLEPLLYIFVCNEEHARLVVLIRRGNRVLRGRSESIEKCSRIRWLDTSATCFATNDIIADCCPTITICGSSWINSLLQPFTILYGKLPCIGEPQSRKCPERDSSLPTVPFESEQPRLCARREDSKNESRDCGISDVAPCRSGLQRGDVRGRELLRRNVGGHLVDTPHAIACTLMRHARRTSAIKCTSSCKNNLAQSISGSRIRACKTRHFCRNLSRSVVPCCATAGIRSLTG